MWFSFLTDVVIIDCPRIIGNCVKAVFPKIVSKTGEVIFASPVGVAIVGVVAVAAVAVAGVVAVRSLCGDEAEPSPSNG